jgi:orotate phosphoribosyltransferase
MLYRQELCNLDIQEEAEILVKIAGESLENSEYTLVGGLPSKYYFDIDNYLSNKANINALSKLLVRKINDLSTKFEFDKVAVIDKGGSGPVGLIILFALLSVLLEKEMLIVRPKKKLLRGAIKGALKKDERVLLLNDVATQGWTIFESAEKIWACGGKVPYALVVIDRWQGATENLGRKGLQLFSLTSAKMLREKKGAELEKRYNLNIAPFFEPVFVDFGGSARTMVK